MTSNHITQAIETKLYFIVFALFASFLALAVYNAAMEVFALDETLHRRNDLKREISRGSGAPVSNKINN